MGKRKLKKRHFRKMKLGFIMTELRRLIDNALFREISELTGSLTEAQQKQISDFVKENVL